MGLLIKNGGSSPPPIASADVYCDGGKIVAIGEGLDSARAKDEVLDASGQFVFPASSIRTSTWSCRSWARCRPTTSSPAPPRASRAARPASSTSASRRAASRCSKGSRSGSGAARRRSPTTRYHMAITGWTDRTAEEMRAVVQQHGITSFKVFMAYKGAIMVDDGELYQVMKQAGEARRGRDRARRERRRGVQPAEGAGRGRQARARVPSGVAAEQRSRARPPSRALMMARLHGATRLHRAHDLPARRCEALERAKLRGQTLLRRDLPAVPAARRQRVRQARLRGLGLRDEPADPPAAPRPPRRAVDRAHERHARLGRHRSLPVHDGAEEDGQGQLHPDPQRRRRHRGPPARCSTPTASASGHFDLQRMVALGSTNPARIFGLYPRKGTIAVGSRRRPRALRSEQRPARAAPRPITRAPIAASSRASRSRASRRTWW